jgi:hypothetical protein
MKKLKYNPAYMRSVVIVAVCTFVVLLGSSLNNKNDVKVDSKNESNIPINVVAPLVTSRLDTQQSSLERLTPKQQSEEFRNSLDGREARTVVIKSVKDSILKYQLKYSILPKSAADIKTYCDQFYNKIPIKNYTMLKDYTSDPGYVTCSNPSTLGLKILNSKEEYDNRLSVVEEEYKKQLENPDYKYKYSNAYTVFLTYGTKCLAPEDLQFDGTYDTRYSTKSKVSTDYAITMAEAWGTVCLDNYDK